MSANVIALLYLVAGGPVHPGAAGLSHPETARQGNQFGMIGMAIAVVTTLFAASPAGSWLVADHRRVAIGGGIGAVIAARIPMTAMPQLVAGFHSLVGMAAVLVAAAALYSPAAFGIGTVGQHPYRQPDRDVARRGHRRHHLHRLGHRLHQAHGLHVGRADPAPGAALSSTSPSASPSSC
jgi:NAD/NADP transhydrogenase beta subunit